MQLDYRDQQLDAFLEKGERQNCITEHPVESLFDPVDDIPELEPEVLKKPVRWMRCGDSEFFVETK